MIRLLFEMINSLPIVENRELKESVIQACVQFFYSLQLVEREEFVKRIAL